MKRFVLLLLLCGLIACATSRPLDKTAIEAPSGGAGTRPTSSGFVVFKESVVIGGGGPWERGKGELLVPDGKGSGLEGFGFVRAGTAFDVVGRLKAGLLRVQFRCDGKMDVWALLHESMLGRFAARQRQVPNTSLYVIRGSLVRVLASRPGSIIVEGTVRLPADATPLVPAGTVSRGIISVRGFLSAADLSTVAQPKKDPPGKIGSTPGGQDVRVFDSPGGKRPAGKATEDLSGLRQEVVKLLQANRRVQTGERPEYLAAYSDASQRRDHSSWAIWGVGPPSPDPGRGALPALGGPGQQPG